MKKLSRVLVVLVVLIALAVVATACNKDKVDEIYVAPEDMPSRTTFVVGQEIDLFGGTLTVVKGGQTYYEPLDSNDIELSYDHEKDGEVPVTLKYKGASTTITLNFVKRLVLENANLDYFVGESFNRGVGNLILTRDDGTTKSYPLSDSGISVNGFDTSSVGTTEFEIGYGEYTEKVTAKVHTLVSKDYGVPSKTFYQSHEEVVDLSGGYILYKSNDDYVRRISLTQDMVSGFNPRHATMANREVANADPQTVTITFPGYDFETSNPGYTFEYHISVQYSDVSVIREYADALKGVEYNYDIENDSVIFPDKNMLSDELLAKSKEAVELYGQLDQAEKDLITTDEKGYIIRPVAMTYYFGWFDSLKEFADTFILNSGTVNFVFSSYEQTKIDYEKLTAPDAAQKDYFTLNAYLVELLSNKDAYEDLLWASCLTDPKVSGISLEELLGNVGDFKQFCSAYLPMIDKMLEIYSLLDESVIAKDWTYDTLTSDNKAAIESVYEILSSSEMYPYLGNPFQMTVNFRPFYQRMSNWRQDGDFFEIVYTYYYNKYLSATSENEKSTYGNVLSYIANYYQLPGELENVYNDVYYMLSEYVYMNDAYSKNAWYEAANFISYFFDANETINNINSEEYDNEMIKFILRNVGITGVLNQQNNAIAATFSTILLTFKNMAYNSLVGPLVDVPEFNAMWNTYRKVLSAYKNGEYLTTSITGETIFTDKFKTDLPALFESYSELSPVLQYGFTRSFSVYDEISPYMIDQSSGSLFTTFGLLVLYYYRYYLPEEEGMDEYVAEMIEYLLYAQDYLATGDIDSFKKNMKEAIQMYGDFDISEINDFDNKARMRSVYNKLNSIYRLYSDDDYQPNLSEEAKAMFDELYDYAIKGITIVNTLNQVTDDGYLALPIFGVLVATYEKVEALSKNLIKYIEQEGDEELYNAYYLMRYDVFKDGENLYTLEYLIMAIRSNYVDYLQNYTVPYQGITTYLYEVYNQSELKPFVEKTADFLLAATIVENAGDVPSFEGIELSYVKEILDDFRNLTLDEKIIYLTLHQYYNMYYEGLIMYFADDLGYDVSKEDNILSRLFELEFASTNYQYCYTYLYDMDELEEIPEELQKTIDTYNKAVEDFFAAYGNLDATSKANFEDVFGAFADEYTKEYAGTMANPRA